MDYSKALNDKIDKIVAEWIQAVYQDGEIESTKQLTHQAVKDSLPLIIEAIATLLSDNQENDITNLIKNSLKHGFIRAKQGFDVEEITREYRLLRQVIFSVLEADLLLGTPQEILQVVSLINTALDEIITRCLQSYVHQRLEDLEQLQNQLLLTNQELTRLVNTHQTNISHLAHELKNPLNSIIGYSELFLRRQEKISKIENSSGNVQNIERVLRNGRQILRLINDTLEVSRFQSGKMSLNLVSIDVCSLINSVIEVLEPLATQKGLELISSCTLIPNPVITDPLRLQQILTNLVSNAIRYTNSGKVKVSCQIYAHKELVISVSDTGLGIAPEEQGKIFDPYYRAGEKGKFLPDSTGLGLAIVSQVVELLEGEIELFSELGVGSTFRVILPLQVKTRQEALSSKNLC